MPQGEPNIEPPYARRNWLRWLVFAAIVAALAAFYAFGLQEYFDLDYVRSHLADFKAWVNDNFLIAMTAFFLLYCAITGLSLPVALIMSLLAGALFGRFLGTAIVLLAATVGATLAFLSSRFLLRDWVQRRFGSRLEAFNRGVEKDGAYYLFTLRLVPLFPFFLINLGMGLTSIRTWTYFWVSLIGMLPGTFVYVNTGQAFFATLESPRGILSTEIIVALVLLGVVPLLIRWGLAWFRRVDKES